MRRRDEPKLDELKKLLRRLEKMDAASGDDASGKAGSAAAPGYVGALRGAAPTPADGPASLRRNSETDVRAALRGGATRPEPKSRAFGLGAIIIGATTAAIVSSILVISLSPGARQEKPAPPETSAGDTERRPAFVAPSAFSDSVPVAVPPQSAPATINAPTPQLSPPAASGVPSSPMPPDAPRLAPHSEAGVPPLDEIEQLLRRSDALIREGNLAEARLVLERAAVLGSGTAALTLGASYDPTRIADFGKTSARFDVALARSWYERARALGTAEATSRLTELAKR
jgi:hypothetical protein